MRPGDDFDFFDRAAWDCDVPGDMGRQGGSDTPATSRRPRSIERNRGGAWSVNRSCCEKAGVDVTHIGDNGTSVKYLAREGPDLSRPLA